jgi:hypothetical protein
MHNSCFIWVKFSQSCGCECRFSETPLSCGAQLSNLRRLIYNHAWMSPALSSVITFLWDCLILLQTEPAVCSFLRSFNTHNFFKDLNLVHICQFSFLRGIWLLKLPVVTHTSVWEYQIRTLRQKKIFNH